MSSEFEDSTESLNSTKAQIFGYGIGLSLGALILCVIIACVAYICTRLRVRTTLNRQFSIQRNSIDTTTAVDSVTMHQGLDEATLSKYPQVIYSKLKFHYCDSTASACSICLADYKDTDLLRMLPDCGHIFHLKCVDPWLMFHPTCPVCRNSPKPTPLADVSVTTQ